MFETLYFVEKKQEKYEKNIAGLNQKFYQNTVLKFEELFLTKCFDYHLE